MSISSRSTGDLITAAIWNADVVDQINGLEAVGSWTPVIGGSGGTSGQTYATQLGRYTKIYRTVFAWFEVTLTNKGTITTNVQIQGLPFTSENTSNLYGSCQITAWITASSFVYLTGRVDANTTAVTLQGATAAATSLSALATADISNSSLFRGVVIYRTAS